MRQIIKSASAKIRLKKAYDDAEIVPFDLSSKFVIMSDCHRGQGNNDDNFLSNQNLFFAALDHYYKNGFTYIELGDGDELWENRRLEPIISCHSDAFWLMSSFYRENRFYMLYGNHDAAKRREGFIKKHFGDYYCDSANCRLPLFPGIKIHKSLILEASDLCESGKTIRLFLVHGHQGSLLNDALWPLARFLVRYIWGPLEMIGFSAPTWLRTSRRQKG